MGDLEGAPPEDLLVAKAHRALSLDHAEDGLGHGRAPHPVAAQQRDDLAFADMRIDAVEDMALAVVGVQALHVQHALAHQCAPSVAGSSRVVPR